MQQVIIGPKYQIVIPKEIRKKVKGIKPGNKVAVSAKENTITVQVEAKNWVEESYGFMKEAWKGIDPIKELEKMRDEWEERSQEFEKELKCK